MRILTSRSWIALLAGSMLLLGMPGEETAASSIRAPYELQPPVTMPAGSVFTGGKPAPVSPPAQGWAAKRPDASFSGGQTGGPPADQLLAGMRGRLQLLQEARRWNVEREAARQWIVTPEAAANLGRLHQANPRSLRLAWHEGRRTPRFIAGTDLRLDRSLYAGSDAQQAKAFLREHRELLRLSDPDTELVRWRVEESREGFRAYRFKQMHQGLPIWAHDVVVRFSPDGRAIGFSGQYRPTPTGLSREPQIPRSAAVEAAITALARRDGVVGEEESNELIYFPHGEKLRLAWRVVVRAGAAYRMEVFVDAASGEFLHAVSLVCDGAATGQGVDLAGGTQALDLWEESGTYLMVNTSKAMFDAGASEMPNNPVGAVWVINANHTQLEEFYHVTSTNPDSWTGNANAVSAAAYASSFYDFIATTFGRSSIDGAGRTIMTVVNMGSNYANAFWNGSVAAFGNGDGASFSDLAGSRDVVCHELGHAVVEFTANLIYEFQPGATNEHFADVFGSLTEWYAEGAGGNWLMGEDVTTPGVSGDCLRNMETPDHPDVYNPPAPHFPTHMDEYFDLTSDQDHGGVHINMTIPSRAFVIVCEAIGRDKTQQIWYRALTQYLNRNSQFIDLRLGAIQAAADLHGAESIEEQTVADAFDTVGIVGEEGTEDPPDLPDNEGSDFLAIWDPDGGHIYRVPPDWGVDADDISQNAMGGGGRPSFSDDGSLVAWVGADDHIYLANSDGSDRVQISVDAEWWSVALSAGGRYLAAKTVYEEGRIYVFDLVEPESGAYYDLVTQNDSGGEGGGNVIFADVMEFAVAGDYLLYDAQNSADFGGGVYEYWDINMLRLSDGACFRVFQSLPQGENIGNPTLAQNQDDLIAFDHMDGNGDVYVRTFNLQTGDQGTVTYNFSVLGRPTFSGDDGQIYYQYPCSGYDEGVWVVSMAPDGLNGAGNDECWGYNCGYPVWFTLGERPTPVWLRSLGARWYGGQVTVEWQVVDAALFVGFLIERGASPDGPFERCTPEMIPADAAVAGSFRFDDPLPPDAANACYRLIGIDRSGRSVSLGITGITPPEPDLMLTQPLLRPNGPNPFSRTTTLRFFLPAGSAGAPTDLSIYDLQGRLRARPLAGAMLDPGEHTLEWEGCDARGVPLDIGAYYLRLQAGERVATRKVTIAR
ncbi:MAG: M4 family metallopeptidase [Candidatus Eisenbacteria sp.]|nr:M4 family metallopeptidase [Candidatus Eisenbacteria bacterium]